MQPTSFSTTSSEEGSIQFSTSAKYALVALGVATVAGLILLSLGLTQTLGAAATPGFYGSVAVGGGVVFLSVSSIIGMMIANRKKIDGEDHSTQPLSELGQAAVDFALEELKKFPQEKDPKEAFVYLHRLYRYHYYPLLERAIADCQKNACQENAWQQQNVIASADTCMKISFAASYLLLKYYSDPGNGLKFSVNMVDTNRKLCPMMYHICRCVAKWEANGGPLKNGGLVFQEEDEVQDYAKAFYLENTPQYQWRMLYNEISGHLIAYIDQAKLKDIRTRFESWIEQDEGKYKQPVDKSILGFI